MDFIFLMILMCIFVLAVFCLIIYCKYKSLNDIYKYLNKELDSLSYEVYHRDNAIFKKCDKNLTRLCLEILLLKTKWWL